MEYQSTYGVGVLKFSDFLQIHAEQKDQKALYYQTCKSIVLDRQVGNRYFVSASNAGKILVLAEAAVEFLEYTGKNNGTRLERTVYEKLKDPDLLSRLKADSLMFYHVYADIVMLAKSKVLGKSAFDMGNHYLELKVFLEEVHKHTETAFNRDHRVFLSEDRLYSSDPGNKLNHRKHSSYLPVCEHIFQTNATVAGECDGNVNTHLTHGCVAMLAKLVSYAKDQLPGGRYWNLESNVKDILSNLPANNDLCESLLGLNDYLVTAIPNMEQITRSGMVQVKKNQINEVVS